MIEQERKYLYHGELPEGIKPINIKQGYLMLDGHNHLRIRVIDNTKAYLCYKMFHSSILRDEYEYEIPLIDGLNLLDSTKMVVVKMRYVTYIDIYHVDIDVYPNGLKIVEIEFLGGFPEYLPKYFGEEVTGVDKYSNIQMAIENSKK